ncbi:MAG: FixH family protein [Bacteroidota bacterium]
MKFHWGHGIFTFYATFAVVLIMAVIKSTTYDNSLVADDYYARDINYQQEYDRIQNAALLDVAPELKYQRDEIYLSFPDQLVAAKGEALLYRPSSNRFDRSLVISGKQQAYRLPTQQLPMGRYRLIVEWEMKGRDYQHEFDVVLQPDA